MYPTKFLCRGQGLLPYPTGLFFLGFFLVSPEAYWLMSSMRVCIFQRQGLIHGFHLFIIMASMRIMEMLLPILVWYLPLCPYCLCIRWSVCPQVCAVFGVVLLQRLLRAALWQCLKLAVCPLAPVLWLHLQLDILSVCQPVCPFELPTATCGNLGLTSCRRLALSLCSCNMPLVGARVWYCLGFDKVVVGLFHNVLYSAQINLGCAYTGLCYCQI